MKKVMILVLMAVLLAALPVEAKEHDTASVAQLMITTNHLFLEDKDRGTAMLVVGTFFYDFNADWPIFFGYGGYVISSDNFNLYLLGVSVSNPSGLSLGPSVWAEYVGDKYSYFAEVESYIPTAAGTSGEDAVMPPHAYYGFADVGRQFPNDIKLGLACEIYGRASESKMDELACGPYVQFDKRYQVWAFYDETPSTSEYNNIGLRFKFSI